MSSKKFAVFSGFIALIMVITPTAFAEGPVALPADPVTVSGDQQAESKNTNETQWAWGEVTNLDAQAKTITLKYLDYETDQEKELVLSVDEKTTFENINNFEGIKIKDTLSIDYTTGSDGKNIAKNINFEKSDSSPAAVAPAAENTQPAQIAVAPVADASAQVTVPAAQVSVPVETPAPAAAPASEAPASEAPAAQDSQAQQ